MRDQKRVERNGGAYPEPALLEGIEYSNGVQITCSGAAYYVYPTSGKKSFKVRFGINDDAEGATNIEAILSVFDQDGRELGPSATVAVGHSEPREYPTTGVTQMKIKCYSRDKSTRQVRAIDRIALGDARLN